VVAVTIAGKLGKPLGVDDNRGGERYLPTLLKEYVMCVWRRSVLLAALLCCGPAGAVGGAESGPDLLGIRRLQQQLRGSDGVPPGVAHEPFLRPQADEVDSLAMVEESQRVLALAWLQHLASHPALLDRAHLDRLTAQMSELPEATVSRWWRDSGPLRDRWDSDEWQRTQRWLQEFLAVQAVYPPAELVRFREALTNLTASEFLTVLDHFEAVYLQRMRRQAATDELRRQALVNNREMRALKLNQRTPPLRSQPSQPFPTPVVGRPRPPIYAHRGRSLSQRVSDVYILRAVYGDSFVWWSGW